MGNKCLGQAVRPNDPQRKSDTDTRVDPKTSPVPRLEGNPPAVRRAFLFYGKKARRAVGSMTNHRPNLNTQSEPQRRRDREGAFFTQRPSQGQTLPQPPYIARTAPSFHPRSAPRSLLLETGVSHSLRRKVRGSSRRACQVGSDRLRHPADPATR